MTPRLVAAATATLLFAGSAVADTNPSIAAGPWMAEEVWGTPPVAGDTNTWCLQHVATGGPTDFLGETLVITDGVGLQRTNGDGVEEWNLNKVIVESGGRLLFASSNRRNRFSGSSLTLEDGALLRGVGRNSTRYAFDTWTVASDATVLFRSNNPAIELQPGPSGSTDMTGFRGTLELVNAEGTNADLAINFDIPEEDASIQLFINDTDPNPSGIVRPTLYGIPNGVNVSFASVRVHQVRLATDTDKDGRWDEADGDVLTVQDLTLPPGTYTKEDLANLGDIGASFVDQGNGDGTITVPGTDALDLKIAIDSLEDDTLNVTIEDVPAGQTFHLQGSSDLQSFAPFEPAIEFDSSTLQPIAVPVGPSIMGSF